jgi:murein DD-endopeptidase MepM/ murein hydrolase activator NlpD
LPRVPTYAPTEGWVSPNTAQLRAPDVSSAAQGVAAAGENLGAQVQRYADVKDQITAMSEETQARAQALEDGKKVAVVLANYSTLQGQNAVDAQKDTAKQIADIQQAGQQAMGTPRMQRFYSMHAAPIYAAADDHVVTHAVQQTHAAYGQQLKAETDAAIDAAPAYYGDSEKLGVGLGVVANKAKAYAMFTGLDGAAATEYVKNRTGEGTVSAVRAALANNKVDLAESILKQYGGDNLPFAMRNQVELEMAGPRKTRFYGAVFNGAVAGATQPPQMDEDGKYVVPPASSPAPGTGIASTYQMPVAGSRVTDDYAAHQARGSAGVDLAVPVNTPIKPVALGVVVKVGSDDRSGNFVMVRHPDGVVSSYAHMGQVTAKEGDQVTPNMAIGTVGLTGDTSGAHVHLRMRDASGKDIDPMSVLGGKPGTVASVTSSNGLAQYDEATVVARIKAMNLSPEDQAGAIDYARQQMRQAKVAANDTYEQAKQQTAGWIANYALSHGGDYPPIAAVPASLWSTMRPDEAATIKLNIMEAAKAKTDKAVSDEQGKAYFDFQIKRYQDPAAFMATDFDKMAGKFTPGQWNELRLEHAKMLADANKPVAWDPYKGTNDAVTTFQKFNPGAIKPDLPKTDRTSYAAILANVKQQAEQYAAKHGGPPQTSDWQNFVRQATRSVTYSGGTQKHIYEVKAEEIPDNAKARIIAAYQRTHGRNAMPSDNEMVQAYQTLDAINPVH